jgi:hypothetical protein
MSINKFNYRKFSFVLFQDTKQQREKLALIGRESILNWW